MDNTISVTTPGGVVYKLTPLAESYARTAIEEVDSLVLHYELPEHLELPLGSTAHYRGTTYTLYRTSDITMHHSRDYEYSATLYGPGERTRLYKVANPVDGRLSFTLTARPAEHLRLLADVLNKREGGSAWRVGAVPEGTEITLAYNHISVLDALVQLATKLETEWGIQGTTLHIGKLSSTAEPLALQYGRGKGILPDIRKTPTDSYPIGRLYANGGTRNIDPRTYGSPTLHFPQDGTKVYEGRTYHTDPEGTYIYQEGVEVNSADESIDLTHIYPSRVGTVTAVQVTETGQVDIVDNTIPEALDYEAALLEGQSLTVHFETGMLAGRDPFGTKYIHKDRRFEMVQREEDGTTMPSGTYLPKVGDRYIVLGCALPEQYIRDAENEMFTEGVKYLHAHQTEAYNLTIELDGIYTSKHWSEIGDKLAIGRYIRFRDPSLAPSATDIRIVGVTTYLTRPYSPKIDLSNSPVPSSFTAVVKRLEGDQIVRDEATRASLSKLSARTYEQAEETRKALEALALSGFTKAITPETIKTLQTIVASPYSQFSFCDALGKELRPLRYTWDKGATELHIPAPQYIIEQTVEGATTLSPKAGAHKGKAVNGLQEFVYSFKDDGRQYYLVLDEEARWVLVPTTEAAALSADLIAGKRKLVGLIAGNGEDRALTTLYGFTEVLPGQLKTDLIRSADGQSFWDLLSGKLQTKSEFIVGDVTGEGNALVYVDGKLFFKGSRVVIGADQTDIEEALKEHEERQREIQTEVDDIPKWSIEVYDVDAPYSTPLLSERRPVITYAYIIRRGTRDLTEQIPSTLVEWHRANPLGEDDTGTSDTAWENTHRHDRTITVTKELITGMATFSVTADDEELERYYQEHIII